MRRRLRTPELSPVIRDADHVLKYAHNVADYGIDIPLDRSEKTHKSTNRTHAFTDVDEELGINDVTIRRAHREARRQSKETDTYSFTAKTSAGLYSSEEVIRTSYETSRKPSISMEEDYDGYDSSFTYVTRTSPQGEAYVHYFKASHRVRATTLISSLAVKRAHRGISEQIEDRKTDLDSLYPDHDS